MIKIVKEYEFLFGGNFLGIRGIFVKKMFAF